VLAPFEASGARPGPRSPATKTSGHGPRRETVLHVSFETSATERFGLHKGDRLALLRWFLPMTGEPGTNRWIDEARAHVNSTAKATT
jgi:hypothetical protein